jgi:hypothetical protein
VAPPGPAADLDIAETTTISTSATAIAINTHTQGSMLVSSLRRAHAPASEARNMELGPSGYAEGMSSRIWEIRHADGGADGTPFARARVDAVDEVLVHAAPDRIHVSVIDDDRTIVATARDLAVSAATPICRLRVTDTGAISREPVWPGPNDQGAVVILPGGEAGRLTAWRTNDDRTRWTWSLEFKGGA